MCGGTGGERRADPHPLARRSRIEKKLAKEKERASNNTSYLYGNKRKSRVMSFVVTHRVVSACCLFLVV